MTHGPCLRTAMLLALATALSAPAASAQRYRFSDRDVTSRIDTTVAFPKNGNVSLNLPSGEIIVRGWAEEQVKIHATSEDGDIRLSTGGSRLTLEMSGYRSREARFEVTVPYGVHLTAHSQSGEIDVRGTRGDVEVNSQSGDVQVEDVGRLDLGSLSGDVRARGVNGDATAHTVSGDFHLENIKGDIDAESVSGEIGLVGATSKSVRAHSVSGSITYEGTIDPAGHYDLTAHSGEVSITVPPNTSAQISVSTWSGSVDSDFPITLRPGEHGFGQSKKFTFEIGAGAARINLESFSGDITIHSSGGTRRGRER